MQQYKNFFIFNSKLKIILIFIRYNKEKELSKNENTYAYYVYFTKCERKAPKFIYGDISSLKNNDSISLFFIVLYF